MKKLFIAILTILFFLFQPSPVFVNAQSEYLRVINNNTPFYSDSNAQDLLFYLPYTYYVLVLDIDEDICHVQLTPSDMPSLDGFVYYSQLFCDDQTVSNPYPSIKIKSQSSLSLYSDKSKQSLLQYIFPNREMTYYGSIENNDDTLYFVSYNGNLGYVSENNIYPFDIPFHPNPLTFIKEEEQTSSPTYFPLKITIIALLVMAGIIALFVAITPKQKQSPKEYYDENEFYK